MLSLDYVKKQKKGSEGQVFQTALHEAKQY